MKTFLPLPPSLVFATLCALVLPTLGRAAEDTTSSTIKFSDSAKPGTVKINTARGNVIVRGTDGPDISVKSAAKAANSTPRKDGLRELTATSGFSLSERNNVVVLDAMSDGPAQSADFDVTVPRDSSVIIGNSWGGAISCANLSGDIEIKSMSGRIKLDDIAGGALVETMNGEIDASVREVRDGKPLSFTSMNGRIVIRVPEQSRANVSLRSQNGAILTDFDEKSLVSETKSMGRHRSSDSRSSAASIAMNDEIRAAVRDVVKAATEATREAAEAIREATEAVKEGAQDSRDRDDFPPRPPRPPKPSLPPMTGGKIVSGRLNGGGTEIQAATMNGEVVLRKLESKK